LTKRVTSVAQQQLSDAPGAESDCPIKKLITRKGIDRLELKFSRKMHDNQSNILINFGCKKFSSKKVMVLYRTTAQPCRIGLRYVAYARL